jgi:small subunit ribosomal protein S3
MAIAASMRMNAEGIKVLISGRLNGAVVSEGFKGRVPLSTFRADIDYMRLKRILHMVEWVSKCGS